jgi:hypothetical protein
MNALEVKVIEVTPAIVKFNYSEMLEIAKEIKAEYEGLIFTEETVKQGKSTVAEIKKIQKSVNDFKIKTKKDLTQSVTLFEEQCKEIIKEFDEPIAFISTQLEEFETKRIETRTRIINAKIDELRLESKVDDKFFNIEFNPKWTNSTFALSQIHDEVVAQLNQMIAKQNHYYTCIEMIEMKVEMENARHGLNVGLSPSQFVGMIEYKTMDEIKEAITAQAESRKAQETEYAERVKAQAEKEANAKANETIAKVTESVERFIPVESEKAEARISATIRITGTRAQFEALKNYMNATGIEVLM